MLNIEIDGKQVSVPEGCTVIDAAEQVGIYIPRFCYHKKLSVAANCRMCLVDVDKSSKPLPACATPVTDGMKVFTRSDKALRAQKSVMEFLLINHPLDCPICDQGGECQLQDIAVGYGGIASRYQEDKRIVLNKAIGPLIATDMMRCIHCTRCVRFGREIGGIMELGIIQRGEHMEITSFIEHTVDSELSGNMIDLCPVGALTSKPFRYSARSWELMRRPSISPHDGLGANVEIHTKNHRVYRVVPRENEGVNECWLSDRDRFSYEGLNSTQRLTRPMVKQDGQWRECDWQQALEYAANGLKQVHHDFGAEQIGALASPHSTLEELYLLQKLVRGLGSGNIDHRLRQSDFSADNRLVGVPWLGGPIAELPEMRRILLIGSTLRQDHPLLAHRLRQAVERRARLSLINPVDDDLLCPVANKMIVSPAGLTAALAQILQALADDAGQPTDWPAEFDAVRGAGEIPATARAIAADLVGDHPATILLGNLAQHHPRFADIHWLAQEIAKLSGARLGFLGEAANSVGGYLAGAVPMYGALGEAAVSGLNARQMLENPRKAYIVLGAEMELDSYNAQQAIDAMKGALVIALSPYKHQALTYADILLPTAPFTETAGTFVSTEGRIQRFNGVVPPLKDTRPAWKVFRVLANLLDLTDFSYEDIGQVRAALGVDDVAVRQRLSNAVAPGTLRENSPAGLTRIGEVPIYHADSVVRRAPSLQRTHYASGPLAWMNGALLTKIGVVAGGAVTVRQGHAAVQLATAQDDTLPADCVRIAAVPLTSALGGLLDTLTVERA